MKSIHPLTILCFFTTSIGNKGYAKGSEKLLPTHIKTAPEESFDKSSYIKFLTSQNKQKPYALRAGAYGILSFSAAVYGQLLYINESYEIESGFLESWQWDFQNKWYDLKLKDNIHFHHGRKVTSKDVEFLLLKGFFSNVNLRTTTMLANIQGVEKIKPGMKYRSGLVSGVEIIDNLALRIRLKSPNPAFLYTIARPVPSLVPIEEMQDDLITPKGLPIGAGPYKVVWSDPSSSRVRLKLNNLELKNAPKIVDFIAEGSTQENDIFIATTDLNASDIGNYKQFVNKMPLGTGILGFNFQSKLAANSSFRKSILLAINQEEIIQDLPNYDTNYELLPKQFWGRINADAFFNLKKAKELFESVPAELRSKKYKAYWHGQVAKGKPLERIQKQLEILGFKVEFQELKNTNTFLKSDAEIPIIVYGASGDFVDPLNMFSMYLPSSTKKYEHPLDDKNFQKLYQKAALAPSMDIRVQSMKELSKYFIDEVYAVPVFSSKAAFWINTEKIKDFGTQNGGATLYLDRITMR